MKHLSGDAGIERMEFALSETRSKYFQAKENGSPVGSPITRFITPSPPSSSAGPSFPSSDNRSNLIEGVEKPSCVVRSLFKEDDISPVKGFDVSKHSSSLDGQLGSPGKKVITENELIVNEFLHKQRYASSDSPNVTNEDQDGIKVSN